MRAITPLLARTQEAVPASERPAAVSWWGRAAMLTLALGGGLAIFVFGSPWYDVFETNNNPTYSAGLVAVFAVLTIALHLRRSLAPYAPAVYALFVAAAANLVLVSGPFYGLMDSADGRVSLAQEKVEQFLAVVPVILLLTWLGGRGFGWVYLQRGEPRRWLPFGLVSFGLCALVVALLALRSGNSTSRLFDLAPWLLAFVAANAAMEELWFRGIFLRPYEAVLGWPATMIVTALVFGATHLNATYLPYMSAAEVAFFAAGLVGLGLGAAWAIRWGRSLWGAVLLHMGLDLFVMIEFFLYV